ncbi:MAG: CRTAC1 family protein [Gemmatimonadota bacterium]
MRTPIGREPARRSFVAVSALVLWLACGGAEAGVRKPARAEPPRILLRDVTREAGIDFRHVHGGSGKKYMPETMGSGVAFLDYDGDGWLDIFLVNSGRLPGYEGPSPIQPTLYRNQRDGTFVEVTRQAGLAEENYGMGVAIADYDNDGDPDIYLTSLGKNRLYRNEGDGTFREVGDEAGVSNPEWSTSAAWLDYDGDGWLDLFVANYVVWSPETDAFCGHAPGAKSYCTPKVYTGAASTLYRNAGDGTFVDVTKEAGVYAPSSKALGVAVWDYDGNGWPDVAVANDTEPDQLFLNNGNGTFREVGRQTGMALDESGKARGGMGIDNADIDHSGRAAILISNYALEALGLYTMTGRMLFTDNAFPLGVGEPSKNAVGFGLFFFDLDLDGWKDIFVANGHVEDDVEMYQTTIRYAQPAHLFWNSRDGRFLDVSSSADLLERPMVARGAAWGDYDNDGDPDILISTNNGPAYLWRNETPRKDHHWLRLALEGTSSNREGLGTKVVIHTGEFTQLDYRRSGSSYLSSSDPRLLFGLGGATEASIEITWPSGHEQVFRGVPADRTVLIVEGEEELKSP